MSVYFNYFPDIKYNKNKIKNISKKVGFMSDIDEEAILPLTLRDGEKPEDIAYFYYGDVSYAPFILMINDCYDWTYDWLLSEKNLMIYIFNKYKKQAGSEVFDEVLRWSSNVNLLDNILYFEDVNGVQYSKDTFLIDSVPSNMLYLKDSVAGQKTIIDNYMANFVGKKPVRVFDYEYRMNENKRTIFVIDKKYITEVVSAFKEKIVK